MKSLDLGRYALGTCAVLALLAGCGGSQLPIGAPGAIPQLDAGAGQADRAKSISRHLRVKPLSSGQSILYVANTIEQSVYVYTYPQGQSVGTLTGFVAPEGECVDAAGDVFIVSAQSTASGSGSIITEYAHGGVSPIATLSDPSSATGCAVDQKSGNLAVSGGGAASGNEGGDIAIFPPAQGDPIMYYSSSLGPWFAMCGYDSKGNLYISAESSKYAGEYQLVRLPKGRKKFEEISLAQMLLGSITFPPSVQWDGAHMTVSSFDSHYPRNGTYIYRLTFSGSEGMIVGTTILKTAHHRFQGRSGQIWINGSQILASDYVGQHGGIDWWSYPKASKAHSVVPNTPNLAPFGIAVSNGSKIRYLAGCGGSQPPIGAPVSSEASGTGRLSALI